MFLQTVVADGQAEVRFVEEMKARAAETRGDIEETVRKIMDDVRIRGIDAVNEYLMQEVDAKFDYEQAVGKLRELFAE